MDMFNEYKELYYKEIELTVRLENRISYCLTFLTIIGAGLVLLITELSTIKCGILNVLYICLFIFLVILFFISSYFFYKTFFNHGYKYFSIEKMVETIDETINVTKDKENGTEIANKHIEDIFISKFKEDSIINRNLNIRRSEFYAKFITSISITFIFIVATFVYWAILIN